MKKGHLVGISILVTGIFWISVHDANFCRGPPFDAALSPTGIRIAEKQDCGSDEYNDFRLFVRRTGIGYFLGPERSLRLHREDSVGYAWVSDQQLLIASPRVDDIADMPDHLGEVAISYSLYPTTAPSARTIRQLSSLFEETSRFDTGLKLTKDMACPVSAVVSMSNPTPCLN